MSVASLLTAAASVLEALLTDTCTVSTPGTPSANAYGGEDAGTPTTASAICKVDDPSGTDQQTAARASAVVDAVIWLKRGTSVTEQSTITVNGHAYAVSYVNTDAQRTLVRAACRRVIA